MYYKKIRFIRWCSYWYQINEILNLNPKNVLEIGVGNNVIGDYLKRIVDYKNMDLDKDLESDIIGDIKNIPLKDNSFDLVCAFQVLEHLPFNELAKCLNEMQRIARRYVLISLPNYGSLFSIKVNLPFFGAIKYHKKISFIDRDNLNKKHYWEIGRKGYPIEKVKKEIEKTGLKIIKDFAPFENPSHRFFILGK